MNIDRETRLRDAANAGTIARRVLERAGLDYCCEGERTVAEACAASRIDVGPIEAELRALGSDEERARSERDLSAVLDSVLVECHPRTKRLLADAAAAAVNLCSTVPSARPLAEAIRALMAHASKQMREEEETLFMRVRLLADARMGRGPFPPPPFRTIHEHGERLREGHRRAHEYMRKVRALTQALKGPGVGEVSLKVETALSSLAEQMHLENNELIPRALDLEPNGHAVRES